MEDRGIIYVERIVKCMFIIEFGFSIPKVKRGKLFGEHDKYPLRLLNFLFFRIIIPVGESEPLFRKAISGLIRDDDWFVKNAPSVRVERAKARAKVKLGTIQMQEERVEMWRNRYHEAQGKLQDEMKRRHELETALKVFRGISA